MQVVNDLGGFFDLTGFVNVTDHRDVKFIFNGLQFFKAVIQARTAKRVDTGTVGFVERGFENVLDTEFCTDFLNSSGNLITDFFRFQNTWSGQDC